MSTGAARSPEGSRITNFRNPFIVTGKDIPMILNPNTAIPNLNSLSGTLGGYFSRHRMVLYHVFAAATSLSVVWNWNWLTGAEVIRILAALPCTFMMLMCLKRANCWSAPRNRSTDADLSRSN
jgi:hypothetical protein